MVLQIHKSVIAVTHRSPTVSVYWVPAHTQADHNDIHADDYVIAISK